MHEELLASPEDEALWERFAALPAAEREGVTVALKAALDQEVRTNPPRALELADVLFRAAELTPGCAGLGHRGRAVARHVNERVDEALADYGVALEHYAAAGEELEVARLERALLDLHAMAGRTGEALACAARARAVFERLGEERQLAQLLINLGNMHFHREDLPPAGEAYAEAARLFEQLGDELGLGVARFSAANLEVLAGCYDAADAAFADARRVFAELGMDSHVAECDYGCAWMLSRRCRFAEAIGALEAARAGFVEEGRPSRAPLCDLDLAELYLRLDARWDAVEHAGAAVAAFEQLELEPDLAKALAVRGLARARAGRGDEAAADLARATALLERLGNRGASRTLRLERAALERDGDELERLHAELESGANQLLGDSSRILLARARTAEGRAGEALELLAPWLRDERGRVVTDMLLEVEALRAGAEAERAGGKAAAALELLERATACIDRTYARVPGSDARLAFFRDRHGAFSQLAWLRAEADDAGGALEALESGRARDQRGREGRRREGRVDDRAARERLDLLLLRRLDADLGALTGQADDGRAGPDDEQVLAAELELLRLHREGAAAERLETPSASALAAALEPDELALVYLADGDGLGLLTVGRDGSDWLPLDADQAEVAALSARLELALAKRLAGPRSPRAEARGRATLDGLLEALGALLLAPVADRLARAARLLVVPYGSLHGLPVHALGLAGRPLVASHQVAYAPALSLVAARRRRPAPRVGAVLAVTAEEARLPELVREHAALAGLHGAGFERLEPARLEARLGDGDERVAALHLAAHGSFQPGNPIFSGLSFPGRVLTAHDVRQLDLDLELVTLSGCETGRVGRPGGEELVGIDQAFLGAGARAVVSSLWVVDDRVAADTMVALHRGLTEGLDVGTALARAQRELLEAGAHPFDWAPFVVTGDACARLVGP